MAFAPMFVCRSVIAGLLLWLVARGVARLVRRDWPTVPGDALFCSTFCIVAAICVTSGILLGAVGALGDLAWGGALLAVGVALALITRHAPDVAPATDASERFSTPFLVVLAALILGRFLYGLRNPPADWDSINYHFPMVAYWLESHTIGVGLRQPPAYGAYYPGNVELLQALAALVLRRETLMTLPSLAAIAGTAVALRGVGTRLGASRGVAEGCALLFVFAPGMVRLTLGTRVDLLVGTWSACALLFLVEYAGSGAGGALSGALVALALLAGSKGNGPVLGMLMLALFGLASRHRPLLTHMARRWRTLLFALVPAGGWYVRNLLATGNPLYPVPLHIAGRDLAGIHDGIDLARTTQLQVWREGYAGHLTLHNWLLVFGGASLVLVALAVVAALAARAGAQRRPARIEAAPLGALVAFVVLSFALFLVSPFSGAYAQARDGHPPELNFDNLRYLVPTIAAAFAACAGALAGSALATPIVIVASLLTAWQCRPFVGHLAPALVVCALTAWGMRTALGARVAPLARGWVLVVGAAVVVGLGAASAEPLREKIAAQVWDGYLPKIHNIDTREIRAIKVQSHGAPFAVVGMDAWAAYYGRGLEGHPLYVSPAEPWSSAASPYHLRLDDRAHADSLLWSANLAKSGVRVLVVGASLDSTMALPELHWALADTARFKRVARHERDLVFEIRGIPASP